MLVHKTHGGYFCDFLTPLNYPTHYLVFQWAALVENAFNSFVNINNI